MSEKLIATIVVASAIVATSLISAVNNNVNNLIRAKVLRDEIRYDTESSKDSE